MAPTDIPKDIPPIDLNEKPFDPKDFTGKGVEGGVGTGVVGGTGPVSGEVFLEAQLDDPVQPISIPTPRYPPVLQSAGIAESLSRRAELPMTPWLSSTAITMSSGVPFTSP